MSYTIGQLKQDLQDLQGSYQSKIQERSSLSFFKKDHTKDIVNFLNRVKGMEGIDDKMQMEQLFIEMYKQVKHAAGADKAPVAEGDMKLKTFVDKLNKEPDKHLFFRSIVTMLEKGGYDIFKGIQPDKHSQLNANPPQEKDAKDDKPYISPHSPRLRGNSQ